MDRLRHLLADDSVFTQKLKENVRTAAIWARKDAILGLLTTSYIVITNFLKGGFLQIFLMLAIGAVFIVKCVYVFNFGNRTKKGLDNIDQNELEEGLNDLRHYFKICLRIVIGIIVLFALIFLFGAFSSGGSNYGNY